MEQAVYAGESSWKWAHLSCPADDGELVKLVLVKAREFHEIKIEKDCVCTATGSTISTNNISVKFGVKYKIRSENSIVLLNSKTRLIMG